MYYSCLVPRLSNQMMICSSSRLLQTVVVIAIVMQFSSMTFATSHDGNYNMKHQHNKLLAFVNPSTLSTVNQQKNKHSISINRHKGSLHMVEEKDYTSPMRKRPAPQGGDMAYSNENILRQQRYYNDIRKAGGTDCVQDVYVKDPGTTKDVDNIRYWYVGKVARCTGTVSSELAIARQINLLEEHATRIRPVELGRHFGSLEFYVARGDTELLATQNDPSIRIQKISKEVKGSENIPLLEVGLDLSIVTNQGQGLFIIRTEDGIVPPHLIGS